MGRKPAVCTMGGAIIRRFALLLLMLLMLLFVPTRMVAQTGYDNTITFTAIEGSPEGYTNETYAKLFDGKKTEDNFSKWCCDFDGSAYVIFQASKAGVPVGYTITTGNDNSSCNGRNPKSWKLYGNNAGKHGTWTLIQEVSNDTKLQDLDYTPYDFTCEGSTSYKYFKWEISAIHSEDILQVGEFELKLQTCSHKNADGSSALGEAIKTVETTCIEHSYTTHECSICHSIVKVYKNDELKAHTLTPHAQKDATCIETGNTEYWQCSVCNKLFSDANATTEITDATSLMIPAKGHQYNSKGICTECGAKDPRYALFNNLDGITDVTFTDNGSYPWQMLDLNADGMTNLGFEIPEGSTGLMSSNYHVDDSKSETVVKFTVEKPMLLTFKSLVSSESCDDAIITLDDKEYGSISGIKQIEIKAILSGGEHTLKLSYNKDSSEDKNADRAFICDLKTATTFSEYVAEYDATNTSLTFKNITSDNLGSLDLSHIAIVYDKQTVTNMCARLGIETTAIKNIIFDESFKTYAPTSLREFFKDCKTLEAISGLEYLNTADVTDMSNMFDECSALESLDLTNFNTAKVTDMSNMFEECSALESLDLTNFNTAKVTSMLKMFDGCSALKSLDLTNFNTAKVTEMNFMFNGCSDLSSLDLTNFNTEKVYYMNSMFSGCSALTTIYASDKFVTNHVINGSYMFYGCKNLKGKGYDDSKIDHNYANCSTTGYFTYGYGYAEFDNATGTLTFSYKGVKPEGAYDLNVVGSYPEWKNIGTNVKKVVFEASFANARPTSCYGWFYGCSNLTTIEGIEYLNTENVEDMYSMFYGCSALTSLDLTNFNTENVTNMNSMFYGCSALESLVLTNFNTAKVTSMGKMFYDCSALTTIYASDKFVTTKVEDGSYMFDGCKNLKDYDDIKIDHNYANCSTTGYFTPGRGYAEFDNATETLTFSCKEAKPEGAYDLNEGKTEPGWSTHKNKIKKVVFDASFANARPTSCYEWFSDCNNLTTIEGIEYLNTTKVTNMNNMFYRCSALTSLDLTNFNTAKVTDMRYMFYECSALTSLDLTNFNTAEVTNMNSMFSYCSALTTIYASDKFVTTKVEAGSYMFYGCRKLKGYDDIKTDYNYANYKTGNFSKLVGKNGDEKIGAVGEILTAESLTLDDDKDFVAYEPFTATAATYNRDMKTGTTWATLCLPFAVSLDNQNFRAFKLLSADETTNTVELEEITISIAAGTPVIIKMNEGQNALNFSVANKEIAHNVVSAGEGNYQLQGIYTKKVFNKNTDNNCYIVKGDKLMNPAKLLENTSTTQVGSKPFRAYMVDNTTSPAAGAKMFSIGFDNDGTTAIDSLNTIADDNAIYYDLQGKRLNAPQKGINIVKRGGKTMKVIIK